MNTADAPRAVIVASIAALIIGRLMWHERMVRLHDVDVLGPSLHRTVARTIIQSEALYSVTVGATLASYVARSDIFYVGSCMVPPLVVRAPGEVSASCC